MDNNQKYNLRKNIQPTFKVRETQGLPDIQASQRKEDVVVEPNFNSEHETMEGSRIPEKTHRRIEDVISGERVETTEIGEHFSNEDMLVTPNSRASPVSDDIEYHPRTDFTMESETVKTFQLETQPPWLKIILQRFDENKENQDKINQQLKKIQDENKQNQKIIVADVKKHLNSVQDELKTRMNKLEEDLQKKLDMQRETSRKEWRSELQTQKEEIQMDLTCQEEIVKTENEQMTNQRCQELEGRLENKIEKERNVMAEQKKQLESLELNVQGHNNKIKAIEKDLLEKQHNYQHQIFVSCSGPTTEIGENQISKFYDRENNPMKYFEKIYKFYIRKVHKSVITENWERTLIKFYHSYLSENGWKLERTGYKKSKMAVKLCLLKMLLDSQFDLNSKLKSDINKLTEEELRLEPLGKDKEEQLYWCQFNSTINICVYKENTDEESWNLVAKDRKGLISLISQLSSDEELIAGISTNKDSSSQKIETPITDTGQ